MGRSNEAERISDKRQPGVGDKRYWLRRHAAEQAAKAFENGNYLETITLTESILFDQIHSRAMYLRGDQQEEIPWSFAGLIEYVGGSGVKKSPAKKTESRKEPIEAFFECLKKIDDWRETRNKAIHGLAKEQEESGIPFQERYSRTRKTALTGMSLLIEFDALDLESRWDNKAQPNASYSLAFESLWEIAGVMQPSDRYLELSKTSWDEWEERIPPKLWRSHSR